MSTTRDQAGPDPRANADASAQPEARNGDRGEKAGINLEQSRAIGQDSPIEGSRQGREHLREVQGGPAAESAADTSAVRGLPADGDMLDGNSERPAKPGRPEGTDAKH